MTANLGTALDYLGVGFFAVTGAMAAAERRQDVVTFLFFGALTGVGGGTLRDLLIGAPVFWVRAPGYLVVCALAAAVVWLLRGRWLDPRALLWMDAVGLCAYAVVGSAKASAFGLGAPVCIVMGVLTACFGGVLRDVLAEQPSVLLRRDIYVTAAIAAATVFVLVDRLGAPRIAAVAAGVAAGFVLRAGGLALGWTLPRYSPVEPGGTKPSARVRKVRE
jgi:uncharacterized membrane protein YeiH